VVVAVGRGDVVEQDLFTAGDGDVRVGGAGGEAADAVDRRAAVGGVVDVDEVVTGEVWVEGDGVQPSLEEGVDGDAEKGRRQQGAVRRDDAHLSALFGDEQPPVGRELHRGRCVQSTGEGTLGEASGKGRRLDTVFQFLAARTEARGRGRHLPGEE